MSEALVASLCSGLVGGGRDRNECEILDASGSAESGIAIGFYSSFKTLRKFGVGSCEHTFTQRSQTSLLVTSETTPDRPVFLTTIRGEVYAAPHDKSSVQEGLVC